MTAAFGGFIEGCVGPVYCVNVILIRNLLGSVVKLLMLLLDIQDGNS